MWSSWYLCKSTRERKSMEGISLLLKDVCYGVAVELGCVSFRILLVKFSRVKGYIVVVYGPNEGDDEERF